MQEEMSKNAFQSDQERYSVYVGAKVGKFFDSAKFLQGSFEKVLGIAQASSASLIDDSFL